MNPPSHPDARPSGARDGRSPLRMSRRLQGILWFIGGPLASLISAWLVFLGCFWISGGIDIDDEHPPWQQSLAQLALRAGGLVFAGGTVFSFFMALAAWRKAEDAPR